MKYLVMITTYGYAEVEAESENDALEQAAKLDKNDVDWSGNWGMSDCQIVEECE